MKLPGDPALREGGVETLWMYRMDEGERGDHPGELVALSLPAWEGRQIISSRWIDTRHDLVVVLRWFGGNAQEFFGLLVEAVEAGYDR